MQVTVGISDSSLKTRLHKDLVIEFKGAKHKYAALDGVLYQDGKALPVKFIEFDSHQNTPIVLANVMRSQGNLERQASFEGIIRIKAKGNELQAVLICDLDKYLEGVLTSEIPGNYPLEAIKAQAVAARTYALHPRIDHSPEGFTTCDSYLCCQNFVSMAFPASGPHKEANTSTHSEILSFKDKPILALFSACAGGHTENYADCFSDPISNAFPPEPIAYLKAVAECSGANHLNFNEAGLRKLYAQTDPHTFDEASKNFRWRINLSADAMEAHMHHEIELLLEDPLNKPFICAPKSQKFGHINGFSITKRGAGGTAIEMRIKTSNGDWLIKKELVIRSVFANPELKLKRLKSARIFFDHTNDNLGLLKTLTISGFGWGHGVGLQQDGARGQALLGRNYRQILAHYYPGSILVKGS
jgi:stage II sporulation protein D